MKVRLTRKFADILNGIDLSQVKTGEEVDLTQREAQLLVAEGWAAPVEQAHDRPLRKRRNRKAPSVS